MTRRTFRSVLLFSLLSLIPFHADALTVVAHRGDSFHLPENTIPAFTSAVEKKADLVELDAQVTKDGKLVVYHDGELDKKTDAPTIFGATGLHIHDLTWEQIQQLDHGAWKGEQFKGTRISTLKDALVAIQSAGGVTLLERKTGPALEYAKLLEELGYVDDLIVQAFDWEFLAALRTWNPAIRLGALGGKEVTRQKLEDIARLEIPLVVWHSEELNEKTVPLFKEFGFELWCYTVDEPAEWERLSNLGVDGIITDKPAELRGWLEQTRSQ